MSDNPILQWVKSHIVIVICVLVILGSLIAGPVVSDGWNAELSKDVASRWRKDRELDKSGEQGFVWPGQNPRDGEQQVFLTSDLIKEYNVVAKARVAQSDEVVAQILANNRGDFDVVMPELFPVPANPDRDLEVLPPELHRRIDAAYDAMLTAIHAGPPPTIEELQEELEARRVDFVDQHFMKGGSDRLDSEQEKELREHLTMQRLAFCRDRANEIGVYLSKETLDPPRYVNTQKPSLEEMFTWQWRVWVLSRITAAIGEINGDSAEPQAPIHSVDQISVRGLMDVNTPAAGARSFGSGSGGSGGGGRPGGGLGGGPSGGGVGGVSVPKAKTRDYSRSVTGRITNEKFDVVLVDLDMVVSLERLDEVLEGFSTPMALSVLDLEVSRVDAFDALGRGEYFGESPVARLVVTVETLWLREWSREFMPDQTRMRIGIAPRAANEGDSGGSF